MNDQPDVAASTKPTCNETSSTTNGRSWPAWRRMDEEQPADGQWVVFWFVDEYYLGVYNSENKRFWHNDCLLLDASFWMPLPDAPDGEGGA